MLTLWLFIELYGIAKMLKLTDGVASKTITINAHYW
jgi:hypothetical protein